MSDKLKRLAVALEKAERHDEAAKVAELIREVNAAKSSESDVEISSWVEFLGWWTENRGQSLSYVFIDTYGEDSPEAKAVAQLIKESNDHEKNLHNFYLDLRRKAQSQGQPAATPAAPEAPAAEPMPEVEDMDDDLDLSDLDTEE